MKNFKTGGSRNFEDRGSKFGGGPRKSFGDRGGFGGGRDRGDRGDRGGFGGSRGGFGGERSMHKATCAECGKQCEVPFKPTGEKPVFCSTCFSNRSEGSQGNERSFSRPSSDNRSSQAPRPDNHRLEEKLDAISSKLERLLDLMTKSPVKAVVKEEKTEVIEKKPKAVKKEVAIEKPAKKVAKKVVKKAAGKK